MYKRELRYSQSLLLDCIARGEAPLAGQIDMIRLLCDVDADRHMVDALLEVQAQWLDARSVHVRCTHGNYFQDAEHLYILDFNSVLNALLTHN